MYVDRESQNIIVDKVEDTANVFRIKLQRLWQRKLRRQNKVNLKRRKR